MAKMLPLRSGILVDSEGTLWVREPRRSGAPEADTIWSVVGPAGRIRGVVRIPPPAPAEEIGSSQLLGEEGGE